jgi:hypothetical protein
VFTREQYQYKHGMLCLAHHMTAVKNLEGIFHEGALLPFNAMQGRGYENLALDEVQARRQATRTPAGRLLHDYVPLYFSFKTPMAARRQDRNTEWVYLTFRIDAIAASVSGLVVSDGNAAAARTIMKLVQSVDDFDIVDGKAVYSVRYGHDPELGRKKSAELLVPARLSLDFLLSITATAPETAAKVNEIIRPFGRKTSVGVKPGWFFIADHTPREGDFFI